MKTFPFLLKIYPRRQLIHVRVKRVENVHPKSLNNFMASTYGGKQPDS